MQLKYLNNLSCLIEVLWDISYLPFFSNNDYQYSIVIQLLVLLKRLNKTDSAVFCYCRFSLFLKDPFV